MRRVKGRDKTLGQLYREIEEQTGIRSPALNCPALPEAGIRLWAWFQDLSRRRGQQVGMAAVPQPIPFSEVRSYFEITGEKIDPWQRRLLTDLDDLYLSIIMQEGELGGTAGGASALKMALTSED